MVGNVRKCVLTNLFYLICDSHIVGLSDFALEIPPTTYIQSILRNAFALAETEAEQSAIERLFQRPSLFIEYLNKFLFSHSIDECIGGRCVDGCGRIIADGTGISMMRRYMQAFSAPWKNGMFEFNFDTKLQYSASDKFH